MPVLTPYLRRVLKLRVSARNRIVHLLRETVLFTEKLVNIFDPDKTET